MKIHDIIFIILFIVAVITILWYIFGDSPTLEQGLLVVIITYLFNMQSRLSKLETRFSFLGRDFKSLVHDFKEHAKHKK